MIESLMKSVLITLIIICLFYVIIRVIEISRSIHYDKVNHTTIEMFQSINPTSVTKSQLQVAVPHDCSKDVADHITNFQHLHAVQATQAYYDNEADVQGVLGSTSCDVEGKPFEIPPDPHCFEPGEDDDDPEYASNDDISDAVSNQDPFN